ncbi:MAG: cation:H+ antiporter [Marivirga sp.]
MEIGISISFIVFGFILLIKGADFMVSGAASFAKKFHVPEIIIGLTIVAMGTSAPEMVVNLVSGSKGLDDVIFGNIIGSSLFNLLLILGIAGIVRPLRVHSNTVWREIPFSLALCLVFFILVNDVFFFGSSENGIGKLDGILLLLCFGGFLFYIFRSVKRNKSPLEFPDETKNYTNLTTFLMIFGGIAGLVIGGRMVVDHSVEIARNMAISEKMIGLTILAAGTSLPELATSVVAAYKGKADIAIGNVIGSNIFNISLILGVNGLIRPINYNTEFNTDMLFLIAGSLMLFVFMFTFSKKKLDRWESAIYLLIFIAYMIFVFSRK